MKLEEIEKLCNEATPGPWEDLEYYIIQKSYIIRKMNGDEHIVIGEVEDNKMGIYANAKFIAASRSLMPKLLSIAKAAHQLQATGHSDYCDDKIWKRLKGALEDLEKE